MREQRLRMGIAFCGAFLLTLLLPTVAPSIRLSFFAPFLICLICCRPLSLCLYFALGIGLLLDLLSAYPRLGMYTLTYSLTTALLFSYKHLFFVDRLMTLPTMTFLFAMVATLLQSSLFQLFGWGLTLTWPWVVTDLLIWPFLDALYSCLWFGLGKNRGISYS